MSEHGIMHWYRNRWRRSGRLLSGVQWGSLFSGACRKRQGSIADFGTGEADAAWLEDAASLINECVADVAYDVASQED